MATRTSVRPEWLALDAEVMLWTSGGAGTMPSYAIGRVVKINKVTFAVTSSGHGDEPLFPFDADERFGHSVRGAEAWSTSRHCAPRASGLGRRIRSEMREVMARERAEIAVRTYLRTPARERVELIAAIQTAAAQLQAYAATLAEMVAAEDGA